MVVFPSAFEFDVMVGSFRAFISGKTLAETCVKPGLDCILDGHCECLYFCVWCSYSCFFSFFFLSPEYRHASLSKIAMQKYDDDDVSPDMMPKVEPFNF